MYPGAETQLYVDAFAGERKTRHFSLCFCIFVFLCSFLFAVIVFLCLVALCGSLLFFSLFFFCLLLICRSTLGDQHSGRARNEWAAPSAKKCCGRRKPLKGNCTQVVADKSVVIKTEITFVLYQYGINMSPPRRHSSNVSKAGLLTVCDTKTLSNLEQRLLYNRDQQGFVERPPRSTIFYFKIVSSPKK